MRIGRKEEKPLDVHQKKKIRVHQQKTTHMGSAEKAHTDAGTQKSPKKKGAGKRKKGIAEKKHLAKSERKREQARNGLKAVALIGTTKISEELEGGEELQESVALTYELSRPLISVTQKGRSFVQEQLLERRKRLKVVSPPSQMEKCTMNIPVKWTGQLHHENTTAAGVVNRSSVTPAKSVTGIDRNRNTVKIKGSKISTGVRKPEVVVTAGRSVSGKKGDLSSDPGFSDQGSTLSSRKRQIRTFLDKVKAEQKLRHSGGKLLRGQSQKWVKQLVGKATFALAGMLGGILGTIILAAVPVIMVVAILYNSPFALLLPPIDGGDTVQNMTSFYVSEFIQEVDTLAADHTGYDEGEVFYWDSNGDPVSFSHHADIMSVYMVTYGVGDTATVMNDRSKKKLKKVLDDMCSYSTSSRTDRRKDAKGTPYKVTVLEVNVVLKNYKDMVKEYRFSTEQIELIEQLMDY